MNSTSDPPIKEKISPSGAKTTDSPDDLLQRAFDHSLQANIISIIRDGRVIRANRAACKLLGYSKKELLTKKREDIFLLSEGSYKKMLKQRKADGGAKADVSIIRKGGKIWPCEITSVIFDDENGISHSITSISDRRARLSDQKKIDIKNKKIVDINIGLARSEADISSAENTDWIKAITNTSYDVTWDWDITNDLMSFGRSYGKVFGCKLPKAKVSLEEWLSLFQQEESDILKDKLSKAQESEDRQWKDICQLTCPDGSPVHIIIRANFVRDGNGKTSRMIGVIHDTSKLQKVEGQLELELKLKGRQISDAFDEGKDKERSVIGMELHDNINQLLGASMLHLDMARKDIDNGEIYLIHSSEYTLMAIEEIRKLTKGLMTDIIKDFGLFGAIEQLCEDTMESHPIKIHYRLDNTLEEAMSYKFKLNVLRIFQEQLNNILKHAKASKVNVVFARKNTHFVISIMDNGIGFDTSKNTPGIGIDNIISRTESYKGDVTFISQPGDGCKLVLKFPVANAL